MKYLCRYEAPVICRPVISTATQIVGNLALSTSVKNNNSKLWPADCVCVCVCETHLGWSTNRRKGLDWSFIPSCHLPSTEEPVLLGLGSLFTLAGLHFLLLPVTAIKISSRSAIMVSSCHCVDKKGKVQHYWNVLDSERDGRGEDNTRTVITVWQNSHCRSVRPNKHALLRSAPRSERNILSARAYLVSIVERKH